MPLQREYTKQEAIDADAIAYIAELIALGVMSESERPVLCLSCEDVGMVRPARFGEDFCGRCWGDLPPWDNPYDTARAREIFLGDHEGFAHSGLFPASEY